MNYFSYNDYVDCIQNGKIDTITKVREESEKYTLDKCNKYMDILKDKKRITKFLNSNIKFSQPIIDKNLKIQQNVEIKNNNTILYKINNKGIYVLINIIHKRDYNLTYRIFNYSVKIIKHWEKIENKQNSRYPIVIPIVLYTGKEDWKMKNNKMKYITYDKNRINLYYNVFKYNEFIKYSN